MGGIWSRTTEILEAKKWKVLPQGNLPFKIAGLSLATIDNNVFSFGRKVVFLKSFQIIILL